MKRPKAVIAPVILTLGVAFVAIACSSGPSKPSDPVLARGQEVYMADCASCHGSSGNGGAGPKLKDVIASRYTLEQHEKIISEGRKGTSMPAFKDRLSAEDIEAVARYEREAL